MEFRTAADVHRFASVAMPRKNPGSLPPDDYWAITAWLMNQNGKPMSGPLGPGNAASVRLH